MSPTPSGTGATASAAVTVCAALRVEAWAARRARRRRPGVQVVRVGMRGSRLARPGALPRPASRVLLAGFAGGLHPGLRPGDVVVASEIRAGDGRVVRCPRSAELLETLRAAGVDAVSGPLASSDHIVRGAERAALAASGVIAVDMESAPLAAALAGTPDAEPGVLDVVRVIVDTPQRGLLRAAVLDGVAAYRTLRRAIEYATQGMFRADPGRSDTVETSTRAAAVAQACGDRAESARAAAVRPSKVCSVQEGG